MTKFLLCLLFVEHLHLILCPCLVAVLALNMPFTYFATYIDIVGQIANPNQSQLTESNFQTSQHELLC